ncbi:hypothetical protein Q4Q35_04270 [Flavivirga aquimarina]|uniref:DUF2871 domain-containing protein n=1 Tax=Flavivirga aquimarina TaxID=2027862 RepID=A0ABT8W7D8_9FLAO|nr:hypothetical protein [Flavivirga aquimarina]MDO5969015.1 hypothetical protein [Flavivirga aquimarina]
MKVNNQSLAPWFKGNFYLGLALSLLALTTLIFEIVKNGNWFVESLIGHLGMGLLFLYFSGKPMVDERIRYLKLKGLAIGFVITSISASILNYIITYPDGTQSNGISSYWFTLTCLLIAFISFGILKSKE